MTIKMDKGELICTLKENVKSHVEAYHAAKDKYCLVAIQLLEDQIEKLKQGVITAHLGMAASSIPLPVNHMKEYYRIIKMLTDDTRSEIELDERQYIQYVLDDWDWKMDFMRTSAFYAEPRKVHMGD